MKIKNQEAFELAQRLSRETVNTNDKMTRLMSWAYAMSYLRKAYGL